MDGVGILGGTFDPVHQGHVELATAALNLGLTQVYWVPSPAPPHKIATTTALTHRVAMIARAIATEPRFQLLHLSPAHQPSYAISLLEDIRRAGLPQPWYWILGLDAFQTLPRWYRRCDVIQQCRWLIAPRRIVPAHPLALAHLEPADQPTPPESLAPSSHIQAIAAKLHQHCQAPLHWQLLAQPRSAISSQALRQHYQQASPAANRCPPDVPLAVHQYIVAHHLYQPH